MNQISKHYERTHSAEHTHLLTPELLGHHTSLRRHGENLASIQQQIEKVQQYHTDFETHSKPAPTSLPPHTSRLRRRGLA